MRRIDDARAEQTAGDGHRARRPDGHVTTPPTEDAARAAPPPSVAGLQRLAGNAAVARMLRDRAGAQPGRGGAGAIQRKAQTFNAAGWGGSTDSSLTFNSWVDITIEGGATQARWFDKGNVEELVVPPNTRGTLVFHTDYWYFFHKVNPLFDDRKHGGPHGGTVTVKFTADRDGKVTFGSPVANGGGGVAGILEYVIGAIGPQAGEGEGTVGILTDLKATQTDTSGSETGGKVSAGGSIKIVEVGGEVSHSRTFSVQTVGSGHWNAGFGVQIKVEKKPINNTTSIFFDREGRWVSGSNGIDALLTWWNALPAAVRDQIKRGSIPVYATGYASRTGDSTRNETVVDNRLADVKAHLLKLSPGIQVIPENLGASTAAAAGPIANERRVELRVTYHEGHTKLPGF
jgi:hypothetical protein